MLARAPGAVLSPGLALETPLFHLSDFNFLVEITVLYRVSVQFSSVAQSCPTPKLSALLFICFNYWASVSGRNYLKEETHR